MSEPQRSQAESQRDNDDPSDRLWELRARASDEMWGINKLSF